jgi:hypothetical protein
MKHVITVTSEEFELINEALEVSNSMLLEFGEEVKEERNVLWDRLDNQYQSDTDGLEDRYLD